MQNRFTAVVIEDNHGRPVATLREIGVEDLPSYEVLVEVAYSSLNFKDGLAVSGRESIARTLPMIAGIDLAGTVMESRSDAWRPGDRVVTTGWGLSEVHPGGYARFQRVRPEFLTRLPETFSTQQAMGIGTAGVTAALCLDVLSDWGVQPGDGTVLVTGAAGGVGSVAVALLSAAGYRVAGSTGRPETADYLRQLGAAEIVDRHDLEQKGRPLQKERWSGAVDVVGGPTLTNVLSQTRYGGAVAACGLAGSADLPASVLPHILRSVALLGVDSVMALSPKRERAWTRLARDLDLTILDRITSVEPLSNIKALADHILAGRIRGRVILDVTR